MLISTLAATLLCVPASADAPAGSSVAEPVRVLSFNIWIGGEAGGQPIERTAEVIRASRAGVAGLQETGLQGISSGARSHRDAPRPRLVSRVRSSSSAVEDRALLCRTKHAGRDASAAG